VKFTSQETQEAIEAAFSNGFSAPEYSRSEVEDYHLSVVRPKNGIKIQQALSIEVKRIRSSGGRWLGNYLDPADMQEAVVVWHGRPVEDADQPEQTYQATRNGDVKDYLLTVMANSRNMPNDPLKVFEDGEKDSRKTVYLLKL